MAVVTVTHENFAAAVLGSDKTVLVDFWASWCGPCKMLSPMVDQIAEERPDIKVCKINVDDEPELAGQYGVMSIPNMVFFKGGEPVDRVIGAIPKAQLKASFDKNAN
jgi:thioredoxin 1